MKGRSPQSMPLLGSFEGRYGPPHHPLGDEQRVAGKTT